MTGRRSVRARRLIAAAVAVAGAAAAPAATAAPASPWRSDHVLLAVTAGPHGARGFATAFTTRITDPGTGPRVGLLGVGTSHLGGGILVQEGGGGSMQLSTTAGAGGVSARLSGPVSTLGAQTVTVRLLVDNLPPGQTAVVVEAFGNFRISKVAMPRYTLAGGSVRLRLVQGTGTVVGRVGDPHDDGVAADVGPAGAGVQKHYFRASTDIGGGFVYEPAGVTDGSWVTPDGNTGQWVAAGPAAAGWPSFAGPRGAWQLDWNGADVSADGSPVAYVYTPLAGYWADFRCRTGCMFPTTPPIAG